MIYGVLITLQILIDKTRVTFFLLSFELGPGGLDLGVEVLVFVRDVLRDLPVDARQQTEGRGGPLSSDDLVVQSFLGPGLGIFLVLVLPESGRVAVPIVAEPRLVVGGQAGVLHNLDALEIQPVLPVLVDPAGLDLVRNNPLKQDNVFSCGMLIV